MKNSDMKICQELFVDGMETVHLLNGTVRMDMYVLEPPKDDGKPLPVATDRIVMPLAGFIQMYDTLGRVMAKLEEDGLINRKQKETNNWDVQN